jgi:16S rRNA (guanine527-N7)-methyltransferase
MVERKGYALNRVQFLDERAAAAWQQFIQVHQLSADQIEQFKQYLQLLIAWNENINITTIIAPSAIIADHFHDSLALGTLIDMQTIKTVADVGAGGGFPGIPLKIKYPHVRLILIEVSHKKVEFLEDVLSKLDLEDVHIYPLDWRTFLRKITDPINLFVARASLQPEELLRMFKPSSPYKNSLLVYWASKQWRPMAKERLYIERELQYDVGHKKRKLIFFKLPSGSI